MNFSEPFVHQDPTSQIEFNPSVRRNYSTTLLQKFQEFSRQLQVIIHPKKDKTLKKKNLENCSWYQVATT